MTLVELMGENDHLQFFGSASTKVDRVLHMFARLSGGTLVADYSNVALVLRKCETVDNASCQS